MRHEYGERRWYLISEQTDFGETLRSSHTALMRTLVETGIVGGVLLYGTFGWIALHLLRRASPERRPFVMEGKALLAGCVGVIPNMALDEFLVGAPWIVFLWLLYVVLGSEMVRSR
jgi:O-antigen ligase